MHKGRESIKNWKEVPGKRIKSKWSIPPLIISILITSSVVIYMFLVLPGSIEVGAINYPLVYPGNITYASTRIVIPEAGTYLLEIKGGPLVGDRTNKIIGVDKIDVSLDNKTFKTLSPVFPTYFHVFYSKSITLYTRLRAPIPAPAETYKSSSSITIHSIIFPLAHILIPFVVLSACITTSNYIMTHIF